ncbi:MAG: ABC transporter permease [Chloroflexi bacterium]|nr:ABC transporter permease [Chloroflexota bacterium]
MQRYLTQRLIAFIPTLFGISIVIFIVMRLLPGDAIDAMVGTSFKLTEAQIAALREYFGFDKPLPEQYWIWLTSALRGDFGFSVRSGAPVLPEILARFPLTLELAILAMLIATAIGIPIGVLAAVKRDSYIDIAGRLFALIGLALPNFWMGTLIILVLSVAFGILPNSGDYTDFVKDPIANLKQLLFPALTLGFAFSASIMRTTRSSMLEELRQDYARTARGKGLKEQAVIVGHCLKNALIPIITIIGLETGYLFGGAIIVEEVFALPGIGRFLLNGIAQRDYAIVQGTIIFIAFNFVAINLIADLAYAFANPRIRYD